MKCLKLKVCCRYVNSPTSVNGVSTMLFQINPEAYVLTPRGWIGADYLSTYDQVFTEDAGFVFVDSIKVISKPDIKFSVKPVFSQSAKVEEEISFNDALAVAACIHKSCVLNTETHMSKDVWQDDLIFRELSTRQKDLLLEIFDVGKLISHSDAVGDKWQVNVSVPHLLIPPVGLEFSLPLDSLWPRYYRTLASFALKWDPESINNPFVKSLLIVGGDYQGEPEVSMPPSNEAIVLEALGSSVVTMFDECVTQSLQSRPETRLMWVKGEKNA